jgi:hypothetical protein
MHCIAITLCMCFASLKQPVKTSKIRVKKNIEFGFYKTETSSLHPFSFSFRIFKLDDSYDDLRM